MRYAEITRNTLETKINLSLNIDGSGNSRIDTGIHFFNHMLNAFSRFGHMDLIVNATGDLEVDQHHTIEDCGIVLGQALRQALGDKAGIERAGDCLFPLDEALAQAVVDISGRGYLAWKVPYTDGMAGDFPVEMAEEFFRALAVNAGITLHVSLLDGKNKHHILEAVFKAVGRALGLAVRKSGRSTGIPSTKGMI